MKFKKGVSGNPRERPRGSKNIRSLLEEELSNKISVNENGRRRTITKLEVMVKRIVNQAMAGKDRAVRLILEISGIDNSETGSRDYDGRVPIQVAQKLMAAVDAERARRALEIGGPSASDRAERAVPPK